MCKAHIMTAGYMHQVSRVTPGAAFQRAARDFFVFLPGTEGAMRPPVPGSDRCWLVDVLDVPSLALHGLQVLVRLFGGHSAMVAEHRQQGFVDIRCYLFATTYVD